MLLDGGEKGVGLQSRDGRPLRTEGNFVFGGKCYYQVNRDSQPFIIIFQVPLKELKEWLARRLLTC